MSFLAHFWGKTTMLHIPPEYTNIILKVYLNTSLNVHFCSMVKHSIHKVSFRFNYTHMPPVHFSSDILVGSINTPKPRALVLLYVTQHIIIIV